MGKSIRVRLHNFMVNRPGGRHMSTEHCSCRRYNGTHNSGLAAAAIAECKYDLSENLLELQQRLLKAMYNNS